VRHERRHRVEQKRAQDRGFSNADGRSYAYSHARVDSSDLYVVEGLR
jgi:hypothetical protein